MRQLLYRPSWQALRVSCLSDNRTDGGWTTIDGTTRNLIKLDEYVDMHRNDQAFEDVDMEALAMGWSALVEESVRLYRVINCLNAVRMGNFGQSTDDSEHDNLVREARDNFQKMQTVSYHKYLTEASVKWDWRIVEDELKAMWDVGISVSGKTFPDRGSFFDIEDNLQKRVRSAQKKQGSLRTRTELEQFVELMRKVREA